MALDFVTNQEIIMAARRNLTQNVWHYLTGGAESETTMAAIVSASTASLSSARAH